jgi:hypothetical protein
MRMAILILLLMSLASASAYELTGIISGSGVGGTGLTGRIGTMGGGGACSGTIDLSTGCTQPMLGGL